MKDSSPRRKLQTFDLSDEARAALERIAAARLWTKTLTVEQALLHFAAQQQPKKGNRK
jgi:predicted transcriptional regulator